MVTTKKPTTARKRAKEPSTWGAIAAMIAGLAPLFPQYSTAFAAAAVVAGTAGALMPERSKSNDQDS